MNEFTIKLLAAFLFSGLIFVVMMRLQKQKEEQAKRKFELFMKSKGLNTDLEEK